MFRNGNCEKRVGAGAPVYLSAVMQALAASYQVQLLLDQYWHLHFWLHRSDEKLNQLLAGVLKFKEASCPTSKLSCFPGKVLIPNSKEKALSVYSVCLYNKYTSAPRPSFNVSVFLVQLLDCPFYRLYLSRCTIKREFCLGIRASTRLRISELTLYFCFFQFMFI